MNSVATTVSTGPIDERKITLKFCVHSRCNYFNPAWDDCYCCPTTDRREYCHATIEECRATCATCLPKCSP
ncbi:hypothetical protein HU200_039619 [Digitaria exilis]|uniref:Uncharacterized protein n=1 Tax=Digitaria exilis TaxID=1010633 RepID=A0A835BAQ4_9POAL|nr:hypothetical protein HU200_039619 [Digitaria exilis]